MKNSDQLHIRDYIFRETISCPLKLSFLIQEGFNEQREDLFRRKTKRILREALAQQWGNVHYTSNRTDQAAAETEILLKNDKVTICGAVITFGNIHSRIPILLKEKDEITVVQVHGKMIKSESFDLFNRLPLGRSLQRYLLMAAYRSYILQLALPEIKIRCRFMFPLKSYVAEVDQLFQKTQGKTKIEPEALEELNELFTSIDGTKAVQKVMEEIPSDISHSTFSGLSISDAVDMIQQMNPANVKKFVDSVHESCRNCAFRKPGSIDDYGCWNIHFSDDEVKNGNKHQFDLIGHHVHSMDLQQEMYQEQIARTKGLDTADEVMSHTDEKIAMYHRKAMQLIEARDQRLPLIFAKARLKNLKEINYPVHFLDFEAASPAVPFMRGKKAYEPVIFQFSCHTLFKNGEIKHTQWLDQHQDSKIHHELIKALANIPEYSNGTIVQFSPFERQTLNRLYREMCSESSENYKEIRILENLLQLKSANTGQRFLDFNIILRDGYYNRFMNSGLSLKQILLSILNAESILGTLNRTEFEVEDIRIDLFKKDEEGGIIDPYQQISDDRSRIQDGITAMHAYLCLKAGVLSKEQTKLVPVVMKRYCTMDTLALYLIFTHLKNLMDRKDSKGDLVIQD